ncbi:MAG TPA: DUF1579 family protein [Anaerolineaceae bacterium]|jgi:hypothetical protein|nr:DUF1579 family protein [Anaerolineaceae bacterium]
MPALAALSDLQGLWRGITHLWLSPAEPVRLSETTAAVTAIAQDQFTEIQYTWAEGGKPQEGRLILGQAPDSDAVKAVWFDTWHMQNEFMICAGRSNPPNGVCVKGAYPAPYGPDWGWQIAIVPEGSTAFRLIMHNLPPDGQALLAVEAAYTRQE